MQRRMKDIRTWSLVLVLALLPVLSGACRSAVDAFYTPLTKPRCATGGSAGAGGSGGGGSDCTTGGGETN